MRLSNAVCGKDVLIIDKWLQPGGPGLIKNTSLQKFDRLPAPAILNIEQAQFKILRKKKR